MTDVYGKELLFKSKLVAVAKIGDKTLAIEYEVPGSHNFEELVEKRQRGEEKYGKVVFICQKANFDDVVKACGLDMLFKIIDSQTNKNQKHQLSGLPPALKGARKSECAPTRRNSPSGRLA